MTTILQMVMKDELRESERFGMMKGERLGLEKSKKITEESTKNAYINTLKITLRIKYGYVDEDLMKKLNTLSVEEIEKFITQIENCNAQEELLKMLNHSSMNIE